MRPRSAVDGRSRAEARLRGGRGRRTPGADASAAGRSRAPAAGAAAGRPSRMPPARRRLGKRRSGTSGRGGAGSTLKGTGFGAPSRRRRSTTRRRRTRSPRRHGGTAAVAAWRAATAADLPLMAEQALGRPDLAIEDSTGGGPPRIWAPQQQRTGVRRGKGGWTRGGDEGKAERPRRRRPGTRTDFRRGAPAAAWGRDRRRGC